MNTRIRIFIGLLCSSTLGGPALAVPDFGGTINVHRMGKTLGDRPLLAILWNPNRPGHVVPSVATIDARLFGAKPSVKDWFKENSGGNMAMVRAGVLGWYPSDKPWDHYWNEGQATDTDGDGWLGGHDEKWAEAIRKADADFNYAVYDTNGDGVLGAHELGILIVIPSSDGTNGNVRPVVGRQAPTVEPLIVDGKRIDWIAEWYTGNPADFATPAHELSHLLIGAPDMYQLAVYKYAARTYSIMDGSWGTSHLDPFSKLKSGWLRFTAAIGTTEYSLKDIEKNQEAIVLYDPRRGPGEYFILENRWKGSSYDTGAGGWPGIFDQGLAIWHILEDPALFPLVNPQPPQWWAVGDYGRNGILMVRRNGGVPEDDATALFDTKGTIITSSNALANLKWVDGTSSGFRVELLTAAANTMRLKITSPVGSRIHRGTASNTSDHLTYINDPYTSNNPDNLIFITPNWNPAGSAGVYNDHPIGVWYAWTGKHSIFNQDGGTMSIGAAFNYRVEVATPKGPMIHTTTADNGISNWTVIDHPLANGKPNAVLQVTQNWNPNGVGGTYNNHNIGVWYDGARWAIFNQDLAEMPIDAAFNVRVGLGYVHKATPSNIIGHRTVLDNAQFNGKPGISILVTPNWNPGGVGGVYNDHPIGVWYNGSKWEIFNQDFGAMPGGAAFNVTLN